MHFTPSFRFPVSVLFVMALAACGDKPTAPVAPAAPAAPPEVAAAPAPAAAPAADAPSAVQPVAAPAADHASWVGQWNGPEGTYLDLVAQGEGRYEVKIHDLDGERVFAGRSTAEGIAFERDGVQEVIRATHGEATGMKWLADEKNCLTVKEGEGFCRRPA